MNPTLRIEKPAVRTRVRVIATPSDAAARLGMMAVADRTVWATAFYAGLRRGELIGLRWEDVDLASWVLRVRRGDAVAGEVGPKSRQGRRDVPIPAVLRDNLVEHRMREQGEGPVFDKVRSRADRAADLWEVSGLPRLTLHDARHTYASIAAGVNPKALGTFNFP